MITAVVLELNKLYQSAESEGHGRTTSDGYFSYTFICQWTQGTVFCQMVLMDHNPFFVVPML